MCQIWQIFAEVFMITVRELQIDSIQEFSQPFPFCVEKATAAFPSMHGHVLTLSTLGNIGS